MATTKATKKAQFFEPKALLRAPRKRGFTEGGIRKDDKKKKESAALAMSFTMACYDYLS